VPELTAQDIAAALAFVPAGLGREVLIACWWPDARNGLQLIDFAREVMFAKWRRQRLMDARTDLAIA
jgi:hypothetical protein